METTHSRTGTGRVLAALAVHLLTASGALLGLLALLAAGEGRFTLMFVWLGLALIVDGVDGILARRFRVAAVVPRYSGEVLDLVVDYTTYVLVPAYALVVSGLLPEGWRILAGAAICISAALYFADREMKTGEFGFRGFPGVWNGVAFYLFLFAPNPWISLAAVLVLAAASFAPLVFIHPFRSARRRPLTLVMLTAWSVLAALALWHSLEPPGWVLWGLAASGLYFCLAGLWRGRGRRFGLSRRRHIP